MTRRSQSAASHRTSSSPSDVAVDVPGAAASFLPLLQLLPLLLPSAHCVALQLLCPGGPFVTITAKGT